MKRFQRPMTRLRLYGPKSLTDQELLSVVINGDDEDDAVMTRARGLLQKDGGRFLLDAELLELSEIEGVGEAKACGIKAAIELARRLLYASPLSVTAIRSPKDAADLLSSDIGFLDREAVRVINLNSANQVIAIDEVSLGGLSSASIHPREVYKAPIRRSAAGIIISHNHPSGDLKPSDQDVEETNRLVDVGELLGVKLMDHIIVAFGKHYSMLENGKMKEPKRYEMLKKAM